MTHPKKGTRKERREAARARGRKRAGLKPRDRREDPTATARQFRKGKLIRVEGREIGKREVDERREEEIIEPTIREQPEREERPTIDLTPEVGRQPDDSILLNLPKPEATTAEKALGVTLAVATGVAVGAGLFFGGPIALKAIAGVSTKALTHVPKRTATITVSGKKFAINQIAGTKAGPAFFRVGNNVKNFALKKSILQKLAATAKNPRVVFGIIASTVFTSLFWAPNEKGDALVTLTIAQRDALKNGDVEGVLEIDELIQETLDISASIPVIGFIKAELAKFKAAAKASEVSVKAAEKLREEQIRITEQGESDFARERRESDEAAIERKREEEERQDIRFKEIQEKGEERVLEEEARQDKRFADIEKERKETQLAEEKAETEKFAKIEEERIARQEEDDRRALIMQQVWRLRREGRFSEADELELTVIG